MIETLIALAVISVVGYFAYRNGKQYGSRKGFGAGRWGKRKQAFQVAGRQPSMTPGLGEVAKLLWDREEGAREFFEKDRLF